MPAVASTWHPATYCTISGLWFWYTLYFINYRGRTLMCLRLVPQLAMPTDHLLISVFTDNFCSCTPQTSLPKCGCVPSCLSRCLLVATGTSSKTAVLQFLEYPCNKQLPKCPSIKIVQRRNFSIFHTFSVKKVCWKLTLYVSFAELRMKSPCVVTITYKLSLIHEKNIRQNF